MRKICVITGTRAEYGLLSGIMKDIQNDADLKLQLIATNMHLSPEFGYTYKEIENDGFIIDKKVQMMLSSDTANATTKSIGIATMGFADAFEELNPDLIVILGDRYEMLAAATAALIYRIPVAHLYGGEITEGAYDDAIRHAISKMSHLHFTSTETYRKRVIQLGENPDRVFNVGAIGVENSKRCKLLSKFELEKSLNFELGNESLMITFHPVTLENSTAEEQFGNLLSALKDYPSYKIIFTLPNSDTGGRIIIRMIEEFVSRNPNSVAFKSLGLIRYLSALKYVTAVVGNSSSGLVEAPSFGIPTLNIGNRQKGRISADSVYHCTSDLPGIKDGLRRVLNTDFISQAKTSKNPYEKADTKMNIVKYLKSYPLENIINKSFYDL